ncbi:hypothetical protein KYC5002_00295 [Archangium violaceum]|uniref:hypothetical protein n=1 Tax=Archangium violaceum TaxID=83451 RepID=UPI002B2D5E37|nr:hypothetical protein KYC5002_00295 [Archangium gephyra]
MNTLSRRRHAAVLLAGLLWLLGACSGSEVEPLFPGEPLGNVEAALCSGLSVTTLNIAGVSSYQGEVAGSGSWAVSSGANAVRLEYYLNGVLHSVEERTGTSGTWYFSVSGVACGTYTFWVKTFPMVVDSNNNRTTCYSAPRTSSQGFSEACPPCTATFYCEQGPTLSCTGAQCQQLGPLDSKVCGGVVCDGVAQYCPPLPGALECY